MHHILILNPFADHGRAGRRRDELERLLTAAGLSFQLWLTEEPGHAVELARSAARQAEAVVAVGGDGTVHEVARGVIESGEAAHLGVIPLGTGNDFVKVLGMPRRLPDAVAALACATPQRADFAWARWEADGQTHRAPFVNAIGIGFDARVAMEAERYKHWPGISGYLAAVFFTLRRWDAPHVCIKAGEATLYEGPLLFATAGNGVSSGGTFYLTPDAAIDDGLLDLCIVENTTPGRIVRVLPKALKGRHAGEPEVHTARAAAFRLTSDAVLPLHADGEILATTAQRVEVEIAAGGLLVLQPANTF